MMQKEFLEKWSIPNGMLERTNDFKMILLSNLSDLQMMADDGYNPQTAIDRKSVV